MKTLIKISFILSLIIHSSCSSPEKEVNTALKEFMKNNAKDPSSYEPIKTKIEDTLKLSYYIDNKIKTIDELKIYYVGHLKTSKERLENATNEYDKSIYNDAILENESRIKEIESEIDNIKKNNKNDSIVAVIVFHEYRAKNGFGALDIVTEYFAIDNNKKVIGFAENKEELLTSLNPEIN